METQLYDFGDYDSQKELDRELELEREIERQLQKREEEQLNGIYF